jgi:antitoxin FitA
MRCQHDLVGTMLGKSFGQEDYRRQRANRGKAGGRGLEALAADRSVHALRQGSGPVFIAVEPGCGRDEGLTQLSAARNDIVISSRTRRHMAQFVVRNLEEDVAKKLKQRARRHARSMEDEVRHILRTAVQQRAEPAQKLGTRIAQRFRRSGLRTDLPELRGVTATAAEFDS